eukprot:3306936-Pleurochrysis_carterae.AAC.2
MGTTTEDDWEQTVSTRSRKSLPTHCAVARPRSFQPKVIAPVYAVSAVVVPVCRVVSGSRLAQHNDHAQRRLQGGEHARQRRQRLGRHCRRSGAPH